MMRKINGDAASHPRTFRQHTDAHLEIMYIDYEIIPATHRNHVYIDYENVMMTGRNHDDLQRVETLSSASTDQSHFSAHCMPLMYLPSLSLSLPSPSLPPSPIRPGGDRGPHWCRQVFTDGGPVPDHRGGGRGHLHRRCRHRLLWPARLEVKDHHHSSGGQGTDPQVGGAPILRLGRAPFFRQVLIPPLLPSSLSPFLLLSLPPSFPPPPPSLAGPCALLWDAADESRPL